MDKFPIKYIVFNGVYSPSEDTFLIIDYIKNMDFRGKRILEVGCGCGIVSLYVSYNGGNVDAVDVDYRAVENTRYNSKLNGLSVNAFYSDLFSEVKDTYDVIIFNPPYIEEEDEFEEDIAIIGGTELIIRFIRESVSHLKSDGEILMIMYEHNDLDRIFDEINKAGYRLSLIHI